MVANISDAVKAYRQMAAGAGQGLEGGDTQSIGGVHTSFGSLLEGSIENAVKSVRGGEQAAWKAINGDADLTQVVTAISNAEVTLQTAVAVRDRVVSAYQEVMRMTV